MEQPPTGKPKGGCFNVESEVKDLYMNKWEYYKV